MSRKGGTSEKRRRDPEARFEAQRRQREEKRRRRRRGAASAVSIRGIEARNVAWMYREPRAAAAGIRDHVAFRCPPVAIEA